MIGMARPGYEPVKRFVRDQIYVISNPELPEEKWFKVVVFYKKTKGSVSKCAFNEERSKEGRYPYVYESHEVWKYFFHILAEQSDMLTSEDPKRKDRSYPWYVLKNKCIRRITEEDIPLFVGTSRTYPALRELLSGKSLSKTKTTKIKRKFCPRLIKIQPGL